ncbi:MAG TPA: hypothetical protein VGZ04_06350 [Acidimicrobiales bacterium]|nr:hypothetical protein [Acidimicrobiales bacterium]
MNGVDARGLLWYLARRPKLVPLVVRAAWRLRAKYWWRRAPYLPLPDEHYWNFRMMTATGSTEGHVSAREIVDAARWSSRQRVGR